MENGDVDEAVASTSTSGQTDMLPMEDDNDAAPSEELIDGEFMRCTDESEDSQEVLREQDRFLPIANVSRIMKRVIPDTGKLAKDAKECCQECVSEFISFLTSEASERCASEKRKTINGEDILYSMQALGFDNYVEPLKLFLSKYREAAKGNQPLPSGSGGSLLGHTDYSQNLQEVPCEPEKRSDFVTQSVNMLVQQINETVGGGGGQDGSGGARVATASTLLTPGSTIQLQDANGMPVIAYVAGVPSADLGSGTQLSSVPTGGATFQIAGTGASSAPTFLTATVLSGGCNDKMNGGVSKHG